MSFERPEITVIVPAYNAERYLPDCLDSILGQTFDDWELIVADDGSSDDTFEIAQGYASRDPRIKVIRTSRQGVSAARNACIDVSRGRYLAFVDADDLIESDYLKELHSRAELNNADITQCSFCFVHEDGKEIPDPYAVDADIMGTDGIMNAYFRGSLGDIRVSAWAKLFKKETFADVRFDPGLRIVEDAYYVYECCRKASRACCFSMTLYRYNQHKGSTMNSSLAEVYPDYFMMFARQREDFLDNAPVRKRIAVRQAETSLWLMRIMAESGRREELWSLRKTAMRITGEVLFSSAPFRLKTKLIGITVMPHIYFAMLGGKV